jgi:hypothetical protein
MEEKVLQQQQIHSNIPLEEGKKVNSSIMIIFRQNHGWMSC